MSDHALLNLLNKLRKRDKMRGISFSQQMRGFPSILSLFRNKFNRVA